MPGITICFYLLFYLTDAHTPVRKGSICHLWSTLYLNNNRGCVGVQAKHSCALWAHTSPGSVGSPQLCLGSAQCSEPIPPTCSPGSWNGVSPEVPPHPTRSVMLRHSESCRRPEVCAGAACVGPESSRAGSALQSYVEGTGSGGRSCSNGMMYALRGREGPSGR